MKKNALILLLLVAAVSLLAWSILLHPERCPFPLPEGRGERIPVLVRAGMNARQAAEEFVNAGVLDEGEGAALARWMARFSIDRNLRPGLYRVRRGFPWEVARQMRGCEPEVFSVTLVPGTDVFSVRSTIAGAPLTEEGLEQLLSDDTLFPEKMRPLLPSTAEGRIAFILPETYRLSFPDNKELFSAAAALWWRRIGATLAKDPLDSYYLHKLAIVASLVEREGFEDEERPRIAGVIANRLKKEMPLQVDATVVYAWKRSGRLISRVLFKDLEIDSPYNTYRNSGLPPDPSCIPSEPSWRAALAPETHDYLYYVAKADGSHLFAETYSGHQKNINKARAK